MHEADRLEEHQRARARNDLDAVPVALARTASDRAPGPPRPLNTQTWPTPRRAQPRTTSTAASPETITITDNGMGIPATELDRLTRDLEHDRGVGAVVITGAEPGLYVTHYDVAEILDGVESVGVAPSPWLAGLMLRLAGGIRRVPGLRSAVMRRSSSMSARGATFSWI